MVRNFALSRYETPPVQVDDLCSSDKQLFIFRYGIRVVSVRGTTGTGGFSHDKWCNNRGSFRFRSGAVLRAAQQVYLSAQIYFSETHPYTNMVRRKKKGGKSKLTSGKAGKPEQEEVPSGKEDGEITQPTSTRTSTKPTVIKEAKIKQGKMEGTEPLAPEKVSPALSDTRLVRSSSTIVRSQPRK